MSLVFPRRNRRFRRCSGAQETLVFVRFFIVSEHSKGPGLNPQERPHHGVTEAIVGSPAHGDLVKDRPSLWACELSQHGDDGLNSQMVIEPYVVCLYNVGG